MERDTSSSHCFWLTRTHFSRAICHRTDSIVNPLTSVGQKVKTKVLPYFFVHGRSGKRDSSPPQGGVPGKSKRELVKSGWNDSPEPTDVDLESDFSFPSPFSTLSLSSVSPVHQKTADGALFSDCFSPFREEELGSAYSSMTSSPGSSRCFSRTSISGSQSPYFSGRYSSEDCTDEGQKSDVKRVSSWSDLFRRSGGEHAVPSAEKWMIELSQLFLGQRFACGSYSRLYRGIYKDEPVAVKVMRQSDEDDLVSDRLERLFTQEITLHSGLDHRNIVKFVGACRKPPALCMLTEFLSGGCLWSFLRKTKEPLPLKQLLGMALDIASGMEYLHTRGLIHRDLKSENLLLTDDLRVKIADFGVACYESDCEFMRDDPGTYRWMAPEMISRKPCTRKVDVFSFGVILYELVSRRIPFEEMSAVQAAFAVVHKNARPEIPPDCPMYLERLMRQCWSIDPNQRPEFWEILKVLQNLDDALRNREELPGL